MGETNARLRDKLLVDVMTILFKSSLATLTTLVALAILVIHISSGGGQAEDAGPDKGGPGAVAADIMKTFRSLDSTRIFLSPFRNHQHYEDNNIICYWNMPRASAYLKEF